MSRSCVLALRASRERAPMFGGGLPRSHLHFAITRPCRLVWEKQAFERPAIGLIAVSPAQFHYRLNAGPVNPPIEDAFRWMEFDALYQALGDLDDQFSVLTSVWPYERYPDPSVGIGCPSVPHYFASRSVIGIRLRSGVLCQAFRDGWPVTPPSIVTEQGTEVGLMAAAALTPEWFPGLPFRPEEVEAAIPEDARPFVTIEWHDEDDLLPECPTDPRCVLDPANLRRWL